MLCILVIAAVWIQVHVQGSLCMAWKALFTRTSSLVGMHGYLYSAM